MSSTVTKTIENVDKLFASIIVNGEEHISERYAAPISVTVPSAQATTPKVPQKKTLRSTLPVARSGTDAQAVQGEDVYGVELNNILHNFVDRVVTQGLADEISARQSADALLAGFINALNALVPEGASSSNKLVTTSQLNVVSASVSDIEDLIPSQASDQNQLADKSFVNSSIATNTANFMGTYTTLADIQAIQNPTNNDYAFLQTTDSAGNTKFDRYKYSSGSNQWLYEYTLNNSSFTAEQWATINSGLTASSVSDAIGALDVASVGGSGKYISAISETDGKISATASDITSSVSSGNSQPVTSGGVAEAIDNIQYLRYGADVIGSDQVDNLPDVFCVKKVRNYGIGWADNDGLIIHIPWSSLYAKQIAFDEQTNFMAVRIKNNGTWESWRILPNVNYDDSTLVDISSSVTKALGVDIVRAKRRNNMVYLEIIGVYDGQPTNASKNLVNNLPEKYRPSIDMQGFALLGYNNNFTSVGRGIIYSSGLIVLGETEWLNGTQIRAGFIYFI